MNREEILNLCIKKDKYAEILLTAYNKGIFKILWNTSSFSIGVNHKRKDMFPELKKMKILKIHIIHYKYN